MAKKTLTAPKEALIDVPAYVAKDGIGLGEYLRDRPKNLSAYKVKHLWVAHGLERRPVADWDELVSTLYKRPMK